MFDPEKYRVLYPEFAGSTDAEITTFAESASCLAFLKTCKCSEQAWMALTAHLMAISKLTSGGDSINGPVSSASIDKVSVSYSVPNHTGSSWDYWLRTTRYGNHALALLESCVAGGGPFIGGLPERSAFKKVGGVW